MDLNQRLFHKLTNIIRYKYLQSFVEEKRVRFLKISLNFKINSQYTFKLFTCIKSIDNVKL